ncbi:MAG: hypothetical protein ACREUF_00515, partial [Solimonas sp.]
MTKLDRREVVTLLTTGGLAAVAGRVDAATRPDAGPASAGKSAGAALAGAATTLASRYWIDPKLLTVPKLPWR